MTSETIDPVEKLLGDIHDLHTAWSQAAPQTKEQVYEQAMLGAMRSLSREMLRRSQPQCLDLAISALQ
jgi:hypothetical protein